MNHIAQDMLWLELIAVLISAFSYLYYGFHKESYFLKKIARLSYYGFVAFATLASIILMYFFLTHNFRIQYVAAYSSLDLALHYLISSFWAGQEGSFLLWILLSAWLGVFLLHKSDDMEPQVMFFYNLINISLAILLIKQSPFRLLPFTPVDGNGLNMLLQDPWMVIHPPLIFLGYAAFTVPFAFALTGFWRKEYDRWVSVSLPWTVFAFVILGAGIIVGGYWAYKVLGWGGYWGWDPVENASLLPWLIGTALMHGMLFQKARGHLRKTNFILATLSFVLILYGTFLTRSGVLADFSVHSFLDLGVTGWLIFFILGFILMSAILFLIRVKDIPIPEQIIEFNLFSRESILSGAILLLFLFALIIGFGTSFPIISTLLGKGMKVPNSYYVDFDLPFAILMLILLSYGPLLVWGKNNYSKLFPEISWGIIAGISAIIFSLFYGFKGIGVLFILLSAGLTTGVNLFLTLKLIKKSFPATSAAITHLGVGLMFVGIVASTAYDTSQKTSLTEGEIKTVLGAELKFLGPEVEESAKGTFLYMPIEVKYNGMTFIAQPDIYSQEMPGGQNTQFSHPHIQRGLIADLYISPYGFDPGGVDTASVVKITIKKDSTISFKDYTITFMNYDMSPPETNTPMAVHSMRIGADLNVSYRENQPVKLKPIFDVNDANSPASIVELPGPKGDFLKLAKINASEKSIELHYYGSSEEPVEPMSRSIAIVEISTKPGMSVLWLGIVFILFGGTVAIFRRWPVFASKPDHKFKKTKKRG